MTEKVALGSYGLDYSSSTRGRLSTGMYLYRP
jgi:hypothetical protein